MRRVLLSDLCLRPLVIASASVVLSGCFNNGPTDAEARAAYVAFPGGGGGTDNFETFKLSGCKEASGAPGYQCDFTFTFSGGDPRPRSGRFSKAGDKWVFTPNPGAR